VARDLAGRRRKQPGSGYCGPTGQLSAECEGSKAVVEVGTWVDSVRSKEIL